MLAWVNRQMCNPCFDHNSLLSSACRLLSLCFFAFLFLLGFSFAFGDATAADTGTDLKKVAFHKPSGSVQRRMEEDVNEAFLVEVIRDEEGLRKGLSFRESMPEGHGMLFVLDISRDHAFWMKGMRFPLDIIFIGKNMQITEILENLQPCEQCPVYIPKVRSAYALELNAGRSRKQGLTVGDIMLFENLK